jgi:hypothetical protein
VLRTDDRSGTRASPRQDLTCAACGHRIRIWTSRPPCQGLNVCAQCPHCSAWIKIQTIISIIPAPSAGARPPAPLVNSGRPIRCDPLRNARQEYRNERERARSTWRSGTIANITDTLRSLYPKEAPPCPPSR